MNKIKFNLIPESSNLKFLRMILLMCIFGICIWAFNWNFQSKIDELNSVFIEDKFEKLSEEEVLLLNDARMALKNQIGIGISILIEDNKNQALLIPSLKADEIFIGVNVASNEAVLIIPMLVKKAIGEGNRTLLEEELSTCLQNGTVFKCLSEVSYSIFDLIIAE